MQHLDPEEIVVHCEECGARLYNAHISEVQDKRGHHERGDQAHSRTCPYRGDRARDNGCRP